VNAPATILYEDERIIVVDKPAGLLTIPAPNSNKDLSSLLDKWAMARPGNAVHVHPCHRLDKDTSGVMLFAKGKAVQKNIMSLFAERKTLKIYLCIISGVPWKPEGIIRTPIDGQTALTQYKTLVSNSAISILKVKLHTGRTNQIRIHFADAGHPLVGDDRFGRRKTASIKAERTLLHAWHLGLPGAGSQGSPDEWTAPIPMDFLPFLESCNVSPALISEP